MPRAHLGLLPRVARGLAAVGLLPLGLTAVLLIRTNSQAMSSITLQSHVVAAQTAAAQVDEFLRSRLSLAQSVATSPALSSDAKSEVSAALIQGLLESLADVLGIEIETGSGATVLTVQRRDRAALLERARQHPRTGDAVSALVDERGTWIRIVAPIPGVDGQLVLVSDASVLAPLFVPRKRLDGAEIALFDLDGRRILGELDLGRLAADVPATIRDRYLQSLRTGTQIEGTIEAEDVLAAYSGAIEAPWYVLSQQPSRAAFATSRRMYKNAGLAIVVALLMILGLSAGAYSSVVRPIRDLTRIQRDLAGVPGRPSGDEIADLRESFAQLERRVRDRDALAKTFLGRFEILDVLGEGAMGMVFRGWDPRLERPVALKTIRLDKDVPEAERELLAQRLVREAVTTARLTDPNIVAVYDVQSAGDQAFIAMELVSGHSLDEYLHMHGKLQDREAATIGAGIARGLAAAHREGILHQDIKPANVLLSEDGLIKVSDFGIANLVTALAPEPDTIYGTPGYLPPETLEGDGFDAHGDLFALGVVLYQCLTGRSPFLGRTLGETFRNTARGAAKPIRALEPMVAPALAELVTSLIRAAKSERPTSAEEVAGRLEALVPSDGKMWKPRFSLVEPAWKEFLNARPESRLFRTVDLGRDLGRDLGGAGQPG